MLRETQTPLDKYAGAHSTPLGQVLYELERATYLHTLAPQMVSGPYQGQLLRMLSQMIRPNRILEIGTFTGYATLCLVDGLTADGRIHTIEVNPEILHLAESYWEKAGKTTQICLHRGDATDIIPTLEETFDLVFLDAGKKLYREHLELVLPKLRPGGFIFADNVLWAGKVLDEKPSKDTKVLLDFNRFVLEDERFEVVLLPIRDGLSLIRKR